MKKTILTILFWSLPALEGVSAVDLPPAVVVGASEAAAVEDAAS